MEVGEVGEEGEVVKVDEEGKVRSQRMSGSSRTRSTHTASPGRSYPGQVATTPPRACAA